MGRWYDSALASSHPPACEKDGEMQPQGQSLDFRVRIGSRYSIQLKMRIDIQHCSCIATVHCHLTRLLT